MPGSEVAMRKIELLAPAKNLETGRQAILHGADAVYIGGPAFGARQAAGNSLEDIAALCDFARPFGVRVYVTLNTILYNHELREVERLTQSLHQCGVSALITQDLALLLMDCPLPLHASTQMDNRTPQKARLLEALGYEQIVLARELSLDQIRAIHEAVPAVPLEAFVHGALCVSLSGQCQASQYCFGRSANRGECAQFCRLPFDLIDSRGQVLAHEKHLLSLRDMNRTTSLEAMIDAGVRSFKIEGRLKDIPYVKNVTAWYRQRLDEIIARRPDLCRSSRGEHTFTFTPDPQRSFNRGFTEYFLHGRKGDEPSLLTPKSIGQPIGRLRAVGTDYIDIDLLPGITLANGDGLCYFTEEGRLTGFRINRAENCQNNCRAYLSQGSASHPLWTAWPPHAPKEQPLAPYGERCENPREGLGEGGRKTGEGLLYRNQDMAFDAALSRPSAERRLPLDITLTDDLLEQTYDLARTPQEENIRKQMSRLGDTPFYLRSLSIEFSQNWFIPSSHLATLRRQIVERAMQGINLEVISARPVSAASATHCQSSCSASRIELAAELVRQFTAEERENITMGGGIANHLADEVAQQIGLSVPQSCEVGAHYEKLMTTRHCLRHALGLCPRSTASASASSNSNALFLRSGKSVYLLKFDCRQCEMQVLPS